ncbi:MAG: hypothetical protein ACKVOM_06140 [Ferruginibacter sp.]
MIKLQILDTEEESFNELGELAVLLCNIRYATVLLLIKTGNGLKQPQTSKKKRYSGA